MDKRAYLQIRKGLQIKNSEQIFIKHLLIDSTILATMLGWCWYSSNSFLACFAALGVSILMFRSFAMMHEAVHGVATNSRANDWVGTFYGGLALLAFEPWKRAHLEHHYWSWNAEKDPVMALLVVYPKFPKWLQATLSFGWKTWLPVMAIMQHMVFWTLSIKKFISSPFSWKMTAGVIWPLMFWGIICFVVPNQILLFAVLPGVLIYLASVEIVNLPHHLRLEQQSGNTRLAIWEQYQSSRSCVYPQFIEKFITLNFNYHTEHHMFPDLAWHQLSEVHTILKEQLGDRMNIDEQFAWTVKYRHENLGFVLANDKKAKDILVEKYLAPTGTQEIWSPQNLQQ